MEKKTAVEKDGFKIVHATGGFFECYFDWTKLPTLDLSHSYYCVRAIPHSKLLPIEYARPNSSGPLFLFFPENTRYRIELLQLKHLDYSVTSKLPELPWVDLVSHHDNLHSLIWGNLQGVNALEEVSGKNAEVIVDEKHYCNQSVFQSESCFIKGRPAGISVKLENEIFFDVRTNLAKEEIVHSLELEIEKTPTKLYLSTAISPEGFWKVRAEVNSSFGIRHHWKTLFSNRFPKANESDIIGYFHLIENGEIIERVRQFGFATQIDWRAFEKIQSEDRKEKQPNVADRIKLQLQISSAHRELFRFPLMEKEVENISELSILRFEENEIELAENKLAEINNRAFWDQAHLELVLFYKIKDKWQEFQRENAHNLKWDFSPKDSVSNCRCELVLTNIKDEQQSLVAYKSGNEVRPNWPVRICIQPHSAQKLVAFWDLKRSEVEAKILDRWNVGLDKVGFHLKVHEEFLGDRIHRKDLDAQILELFSSHQNIYFDADADKTLSVEIVARHYQEEIALTHVSKSIVVPRANSKGTGVENYSSPVRWYHNSQREVRHAGGRDSFNKAKVMFHLHFHSPNLFRAEPFRESFLKDVPWPIKTADGHEVHNPPGEWVAKNCLDSWLPLLRVMRKLSYEKSDFQCSLDISPPVAYVLSSPRFKDYMSRYLMRVQAFIKDRIALMKNRQDSQSYLYPAERYLEDIKALDIFYNQELEKDVVGAFCQLERQGFIEISTCTATHGMAAELANMPDALKAQITLAARSHHRIFHERPRGIWLAENSYFPGVEQILASEYLNYFFVESESVLLGSTTPNEEEFNPIMIPGSGVTAFPRSRLGRTRVWDAEIGYAGHPDFREYHFRHFGLSIKKITSKTSNDKHPYDPEKAEQTARNLAWDFFEKLQNKSRELQQKDFSSIPLITCSYDAELFGHHWWEGPIFLEELFREFYRKSDELGLTTPSHYLIDAQQLPNLVPNPSTWGHEACHSKWSDPKVIWTYKEIARAENILNEYLGLALQGKLEEWQKKMVEQMATELIRAQSSDLTFVIMAGDFEEDMQREILKYLNYFYRLKHLIDNQINDEDFLNFRQYENDMFPEVPEFYNI